jgi:hypothetical protein
MATFDDNKGVLDAFSVPVGELIASVGRGVAEAQREMDAASLAALQDVYSRNDGFYGELQRIGYRPTWYHIPEAEGELQVALTVSGEETRGAGTGSTPSLGRSKIKLYAAPVDAGYASRFGFNLQATSKVRFKIVPVPPSSAAEGMRVAPALVGLTLGEARARLALLGVAHELPAKDEMEKAIITGQTPEAGAQLGSNDVIKVTL